MNLWRQKKIKQEMQLRRTLRFNGPLVTFAGLMAIVLPLGADKPPTALEYLFCFAVGCVCMAAGIWGIRRGYGW